MRCFWNPNRSSARARCSWAMTGANPIRGELPRPYRSGRRRNGCWSRHKPFRRRRRDMPGKLLAGQFGVCTGVHEVGSAEVVGGGGHGWSGQFTSGLDVEFTVLQASCLQWTIHTMPQHIVERKIQKNDDFSEANCRVQTSALAFGKRKRQRGHRELSVAGERRAGPRADLSLLSPPLTNRRRQRAPPKNPWGREQAATKEFSGSRSRDRFPGTAPANGLFLSGVGLRAL